MWFSLIIDNKLPKYKKVQMNVSHCEIVFLELKI